MSSSDPLISSLDIDVTSLNSLEKALTHRSYLNEHRDENQSNERLEFLGDAVLELITSNFLFLKFPDHPEGQLTELRSKIVQTKTLATVARELQLPLFIKLSKGEREGNGAQNDSILADTFEAIIGAIYIDEGMDKASKFIHKKLLYKLDAILSSKEVIDYKSKFQEAVQGKGMPTPSYEIVEESGPDHNKIFISGVFVSAKKMAQGRGHSKQSAEQQAAKLALEKLSIKE